jgi:hypothetical protein
MLKTYSELCRLNSFKERYEYLRLSGTVGKETFGYDRYINQILYRSEEWKHCRRQIIIRDNGCDLGCEGFEIHGIIIIHHINPITVNDILNRNPKIFDPNNLISVSHNTHQAIHYGDENLLIMDPIERTKNDTCPWKNLI